MLFDKIELEADEKIITTARKHWFIIGVQLAITILFALFPVFCLFGILALPPTSGVTAFFETNTALVLFFTAAWLLLSTMAATATWTSYFLDLWVITDRRIIIIDQDGFFRRRIGSFRLERLQDIQVNITGLIPTLLDFGTIRAQTASATENNFESPGLPHPRELQSVIQTAMDARLDSLRDEIIPVVE